EHDTGGQNSDFGGVIFAVPRRVDGRGRRRIRSLAMNVRSDEPGSKQRDDERRRRNAAHSVLSSIKSCEVAILITFGERRASRVGRGNCTFRRGGKTYRKRGES